MSRALIKAMSVFLTALWILCVAGTAPAYASENPAAGLPQPLRPDYALHTVPTPPPMSPLPAEEVKPASQPQQAPASADPSAARADAGTAPKPDVPCEPSFTEVVIARVHTAFSTYASQANRNNNISLAARALDYQVIDDGAEFSFNNLVGPRTVQRGYKEAPIFVGDERQLGLGGGICQVSSTVYMAAKQCGMQITERHPHTLRVPYCTREDEATVSWGVLDFKFRNNCGDPIRLEVSALDGAVTVAFWQRVPIY